MLVVYIPPPKISSILKRMDRPLPVPYGVIAGVYPERGLEISGWAKEPYVWVGPVQCPFWTVKKLDTFLLGNFTQSIALK